MPWQQASKPDMTFSHTSCDKKTIKKMYIFGRYEYYDSMAESRQRLTRLHMVRTAPHGGRCQLLPYQGYRNKGRIIPSDFSRKEYNDEPSISMGIAYSGFFK
jgi:hypothetical protein